MFRRRKAQVELAFFVILSVCIPSQVGAECKSQVFGMWYMSKNLAMDVVVEMYIWLFYSDLLSMGTSCIQIILLMKGSSLKSVYSIPKFAIHICFVFFCIQTQLNRCHCWWTIGPRECSEPFKHHTSNMRYNNVAALTYFGRTHQCLIWHLISKCLVLTFLFSFFERFF